MSSVTDVMTWLEGRAGGSMPEGACSTRRRALVSLLGSLPPETSIDDVHVDVMATRWVEAEAGRKSTTARTYASRVQSSFREYREWQREPLAFHPKRRTVRPRVPAHRRAIDVRELRFIPLSNGSEFGFLPPRVLGMHDVDRIEQHLRTLTHDWQSVSPSGEPAT